MLKLFFFGRVRDQLGCGSLDLEWRPELADLSALERQLAGRGEAWARTLAEDNLIRAVNHTVVQRDAPVADGDEIAFYPPVTGG